MEVPQEECKFDLVLLTVEEPDDVLDAHLVFSSELFDRATIEGMWVRWLEVIEAFLRRPAARLADLCCEEIRPAIQMGGPAQVNVLHLSQPHGALRGAGRAFPGSGGRNRWRSIDQV